MKNHFCRGIVILVSLQALTPSLSSAPITFTVDPTRSSLTLSGNVFTEGVSLPLTAQKSGSLTTTYSGTLLAELNPPFIQFSGGSLIMANTNGTWKPAAGGGTTNTPGSAPADYGAEITDSSVLLTGYLAARDLEFDLTSSNILITNGGFDASMIKFIYLTNTTPAPAIDHNIIVGIKASDDQIGSLAIKGTSTNITTTPGYLTNAFNLSNEAVKLTLVLPINITNVLTPGKDVVTNYFTGQIVATAAATNWPILVSARAVTGQASFAWFSLPGQSYSVQSTGDLTVPWVPVTGGAMTSNATTTSWTAAVTNSTQFYRVVGSF